MLKLLTEKRTINSLPCDEVQTLFIDDCSSHTLYEGVLNVSQSIHVTFCYSPDIITDLVQPCKFFVIQKLGKAWRKRWAEEQRGLIEENALTDGGRLPNSGKSYFLQLAVDFIRDLNAELDQNGLTYARKAMILCGMDLNTREVWEEK